MQTFIPVVLGVAGLVGAFLLYKMVLRYPSGSGKVAKIGDAIHLGAMVFSDVNIRYWLYSLPSWRFCWP